MTSRQAQEALAQALRRNADRRRGYGPVSRRMSGFRMLEVTVADVSKLPVRYTTDVLQNTSGDFVYIAGYSSPDGGDVLG